MSAFPITLRPALAGRAPIQHDGVSLQPMPEGALLHLLGRAGETLPEDLAGPVAGAGLSLRSVSPGQWFAVGDAPLPNAAIEALAGVLKAKADIVDQSHGRVRILLRGPMARRVLAKGTALDLAPAAFPVGRSATTLIGHIAAQVTRTGEDAFELVVLRGFAESLWDDLERMSLEFS